MRAGCGGRNYGWRYREGAHDNVRTLPPAFLQFTDPVCEYDRTVGNCVVESRSSGDALCNRLNLIRRCQTCKRWDFKT